MTKVPTKTQKRKCSGIHYFTRLWHILNRKLAAHNSDGSVFF